MWSSDPLRMVCFAAMFAALTACGFRPLHERPDNAASAELERVKIDPIADRTGQVLRNELLSRVTPKGIPKSPRYVLKIKLQESSRNLAIRRDEVATRANLTFSANYTLVSIADQKQVAKGVVRSTVSYNILNEEFATISSQANARQRGVKQISEEFHKRLSIILSRRAPAQTLR